MRVATVTVKLGFCTFQTVKKFGSHRAHIYMPQYACQNEMKCHIRELIKISDSKYRHRMPLYKIK